MIETPVFGAARLVNIERYPIDDADSAGYAAFVRVCRNRFVEDGLCMLPDFIRPAALEVLAEEANGCARDAWFCNGTHNVYLTQGDTRMPAGDVARRQERTWAPYPTIGSERTRRCGACTCGTR